MLEYKYINCTTLEGDPIFKLKDKEHYICFCDNFENMYEIIEPREKCIKGTRLNTNDAKDKIIIDTSGMYNMKETLHNLNYKVKTDG